MIIGVVLLVGVLAVASLFHRSKIKVQGTPEGKSASIPYSSEFNYRQTVNDCGPFNTAAIVRALTGQAVSSAEFAEEIGWRLPNNYTIPNGLVKQLESHGLNATAPNVKKLSDEQKIVYLQQELTEGHPIIILGERDGFEHYITLFGFNAEKDELYLYDSFHDKDEDNPEYTIDSNGNNSGNQVYTSEELLNFWRGGGMYGLYEWYAIVASK